MLTAKEIRESFKDFFRERGHQIVPSAPMVIKDDPTLMFTNAGMNQRCLVTGRSGTILRKKRSIGLGNIWSTY